MVHETPDLSSRVRARREELALTQRALAAAAGLSQQAIAAIESGSRANPTAHTLLSLSRALGVSVGDLVGSLPRVADRVTAAAPSSLAVEGGAPVSRGGLDRVG